MKMNEFYNLWPSLEGKEVTIDYGYQKTEKIKCVLVSMQQLGQDIYLKTSENRCLTVRPIKAIKIV